MTNTSPDGWINYLESRMQEAIATKFEGEGEAWSDRTSGDHLAVIAAEAAIKEIGGWIRARLSKSPNKVTRVEVIDEFGGRYSRWNTKVAAVLQDDGRTLKVFVNREFYPPVDDILERIET